MQAVDVSVSRSLDPSHAASVRRIPVGLGETVIHIHGANYWKSDDEHAFDFAAVQRHFAASQTSFIFRSVLLFRHGLALSLTGFVLSLCLGHLPVPDLRLEHVVPLSSEIRRELRVPLAKSTAGPVPFPTAA